MLLHRLLAFYFILGFALAQATLPDDEKEALRVIGRTLGKTWDFGVDPCSGSSGWADPNPETGRENAVTCNCTVAGNTTVCHVVSIVLRAQSLPGSVPRELFKLPFLQEIDLTRNYLNGSIHPEWGSMKLVNISLLGNRITGPIPKELGNITTLVTLTLEGNYLSGPIPPELGRLPRIERLILTSNNLTGEIPATLATLSTLKIFRISDNNFSGQIPNFIQNWTNIEILVIQASGLTGPIPPLTSLIQLTDLRISDLSGNESTFPALSNIINLKNLILRSCNIIGPLPSYIGEMTKLKVLDLSFNKLSGSLPVNFDGLLAIDYIYLTGNSLTGPVPPSVLRNGQYIDLSYNNLTASGLGCQSRNVNFFASSKGNTSGPVSCLGRLPCQKMNSSLHINCGGRRVVDDDGTVYEADKSLAGPSNFYLSDTNWGFSSTGHFMDGDNRTDRFTWASRSGIIGPNSQLYTDARLSPLSLTYYAFCLVNGNYTVKLHFTKIMVTDDSASGNLGRRIFDVYIQGNRVLKDFKIENELGGVNEAIIRNFTAVVDNNTLDIRFSWAGKGTVSIPFRGVYGPLISAISVDPNSIPPPENGNSRNRVLSVGAKVGIAVAVLFVIFLFVATYWWKCCLGHKDTTLHDLRGLPLHVGSFTLRQIKAATNNFDAANKIGEGGFGSVYKGHLPDGTIVAVKQLSSKSKQGNREFVNEVGMISAVQHPQLVKLYGCSIEENQLLLVYEYMENNSLARALFGREDQQLHLDWPTRHKICIGIARGLAYLHEESPIKIVHRDIKATNVLLDKNLVPKISDFGLAKLREEDNTHISTRVAGTFGYMAPEYALRGYLTDKADVYSFGVVLLEIVTGRNNITIRPDEDCLCLLDQAESLQEKGNLLELVDARLGSNFDIKEVTTTINVALLCTNTAAMGRPNMSAVVCMLEGEVSFTDFVPGSRLS